MTKNAMHVHPRQWSVATPVIVFLVILFLSIALSYEIRSKENFSFHQLVEQNSSLIAHSVANSLSVEAKALQRLASRWDANEGLSEKIWRVDAVNYIRDIAGLRMLAWVSPQMIIQWKQSRESGYVPSREDFERWHLEEELNKAQHPISGDNFLVFTDTEDKAGFLYILSALSVHQHPDGFILGQFDMRELLYESTPVLAQKYYGASFESMDKLSLSPGILSLISKQSIHIGNRTLILKIWPLPALFNALYSFLPIFTLLMGALLAFMSAILVYSLQRSFLQARILDETETLSVRQREALEKSEETLRQAMEHAPIGKALVSPDGMWLMVNPALCKIVGYTKEELIRDGCFQNITHPDDLEADLTLVRQMLSREIETYRMEKRYIHKLGHIVWVLLHVSLVWNKDGTPAYFISQIEDITERRRVENKFRLLFEHASDPHLIFSEEQGVIDCNNATLTLLGCNDKSDLLGTHPAWFSPEYQLDGRPSIEKGIEMDSYAKQKGSHQFEWLHRKFNGEEFPIEVILTPIDLYGKKEVLVVWHDLTERKKAEKERETLIQKLVDSNSELERFAFIASHDLQEPLRLISNFAYLLQREYAGDIDETGREYISIVSNAAQRMHALIGDLLEYGRIGNETERYELFDGMQCADYIQENLNETIKGANVEIICDPLPQMYGNPIRFNALLQNLVSNSIKYQKPETRPVIHIGVKDMEKEWLFWVKDNGIGMKPEYHEQIFEPFKRLHNNSEYPGTGMGLAICRKVINRMKGHIWVESVPDVGTTFYFTIPKMPVKTDVQDA